MPIQKTIFNIKGMTRDMAVSKFTPELAFENKNLRIVATDENTSFGLVNEKGTADTGVMIEGTPIGQQIINNSLILFTTESEGNAVITINGIEGINLTLPNASGNAAIEDSSFHGDRIYKFKIDSNGNLVSYPNSVAPFFAGDLGFSKGCPIESIGVYENEDIQKVYWVDGKNQPRVINISDSSIQSHLSSWNNNSFNFVRDIKYGSINITRNLISFGNFAPGVIQYCFTYYDLHGSESNIFYTSPLYYISHISRGANPEEIVSCSFKIDIPANSYSTKYDYLRIYSILRTSIDATPQVRRVTDIRINKTSPLAISYVDSGVEGETIDPSQLLFIGGEPIFAGTLAQKDNTLFLGDIVAGRLPLSSTIKSACRNITVGTSEKEIDLPDVRPGGNYSYTSQLSHNNSEITYYKRGECYRVGLQAQHYTGRWSDVAFITDKTLGTSEYIYAVPSSGSSYYNKMRVKNLTATVSNTTLINELVDAGYVKVRPVVVFPDANNRNIICQGVVCPTVYNVEDRYNNGPYVQSSWFFRPNPPEQAAFIGDSGDGSSWVEFRHNYPIPQNNERNAEIQCVSSAPPCPLLEATSASGFNESADPATWVAQNRECFYVDQSIFTLHSPDIEFGEALKTLESTALKFRIVGFVPVEASYSDIDIEATAPRNYASVVEGENGLSSKIAPGFFRTVLSFPVKGTAEIGKNGWKSLVSAPMWFDDFADSINRATSLPVGFIVYPWQKSGGLNGTPVGGETSQLQHKKMSIMRYSTNTTMLPSPLNMDIRSASKFDSDEIAMLKIDGPKGNAITYYGNVDKLIVHHSSPKGNWQIRDYKPMYNSTSGSNAVIFDISLISSAYPARYPIVVAKGNNSTLQPLVNPRVYDTYSGGEFDFDREFDNVRCSGSLSNALAKNYTYLEDYVNSGLSNPNYKQVNKYIFFDTDVTAADPVSMKYKSTPHLVVSLTQTGSSQTILPCLSQSGTQLNYNGGNYDSGTAVFWRDGSNAKTQGSINLSSSSGIGIRGNGFLWLGEIYRDDLNHNFGGDTEEELESNKWIPAGEPVNLLNSSGNNVSSFTLTWSQGDTYYQRYDCLKTYPFTYDDVNSVSDMLSFMCETKINIDGRYDKNRGKLSLLYASPENSNLINPVYSQQNNFFSYRGINSNKTPSGYYPNTITWTKTKTMGETVDSWTGISLASTLDVDGDKGRVRALRRFNNDLIAFQDRGISQILYNENIQIASTAGVPIEIANSGKVSGKRYISNHIGCVNKWSICEAPMGLYFMDDIGKDIYLFDGKLNNLSDKLGFHSWVISNFPNIKVWNPRDFDTAGEITYYDKINGDVLLITGKTALAFSEPLGNFSSFYSYEKTPYLSILNDRGILWHKDDSISYGQTGYGKYKAWWYREGNYNYFFNTYKPYYTTVVANEHPTEDKIFNNLEYRGDMFEYDSNLNDWVYAYNNTFNKLTTWNEYQEGVADLVDVKDHGYPTSNLKKKFRIWRANIPRNTENKGGDSTHNYSRDRMRNPWLYIKLCREHVTPGDGENDVTINSKKSVLHDLVVYYFE